MPGLFSASRSTRSHQCSKVFSWNSFIPRIVIAPYLRTSQRVRLQLEGDPVEQFASVDDTCGTICRIGEVALFPVTM